MRKVRNTLNFSLSYLGKFCCCQGLLFPSYEEHNTLFFHDSLGLAMQSKFTFLKVAFEQRKLCFLRFMPSFSTLHPTICL